MSALRRLLALVAASALSGCLMGPDFSAPDPGLPQTGLGADTARSGLDPQWWRVFRDPTLVDLETRVAAQNLYLRTAALRIAESRAQRGIVASAAAPDVNGAAKYTHSLYSDNGLVSLLTPLAGGHPISVQPMDEYTPALDLSWEIDLWGKVARQTEAAEAQVEATEDARRGALTSTLAEAARDYIQLRSLQTQLRIGEDNARTADEIVALARARESGGMTTALDVENAAAQADAVKAAIPPLRAQIQISIDALSFLVNLPPNGLRGEFLRARPTPRGPDRLGAGVAFDLARRRPDIRQAEAQLHAATATIGVATAAFYPSISLTGMVGLDSLNFNTLFQPNSIEYAVGPSLTLPIFDGGRLKSNLELTETQQQEAYIGYHKTVLRAWHEVADALAAWRGEKDRLARLDSQCEHAHRSLALARDRYGQGVAEFLVVLDAERGALAADEQRAASEANVSLDLVQLYKALGGGWEAFAPAAAAAN